MSNGLSSGDMAGQAGSDHVRIPRFILEDSPKLAKKLQDFEALQRKAQEAAAVIGNVNEIGSIKTQAKQAREEADAALVEAMEKGEAIVEEAKTQAQLIVDRATEKASGMITNANDVAKKAEEVNRAAEAKHVYAGKEAQDLKTRAHELDVQEQYLQQKAEDLNGREEELNKEKVRLIELGEHIRNAVT